MTHKGYPDGECRQVECLSNLRLRRWQARLDERDESLHEPDRIERLRDVEVVACRQNPRAVLRDRKRSQRHGEALKPALPGRREEFQTVLTGHADVADEDV